MNYLGNAIRIASVILGLTASMTSAFADQGSVPPGQLPALTAEWWQWVLSIPQPVDAGGNSVAPFNPVVDPSGAYCMVGQRGPIWFLAGNFTGAPSVTRTCSVPADKTLFFPVINGINFSAPEGVCGSTGPETAAQLRADAKPFIDAAQGLSVTVDSQPVKKTLLRRVKSDVFDIAIPADNVFVSFGITPCLASIFSPAIDDGYYVSLDPLSLGAHTINIQAESGTLTIDVTYNLTVVPVTLK